MDLKKESHDLLKKNRRVTDGHQYTVPSPTVYPYQWLWDSCFHSIILAQLEPEAAKAELKSLVVKQFADGMIPHVIFWEPSATRPYHLAWRRASTSSITQPPMIAYAAWEIHRLSPDKEFLEEMYQPLLSFYKYLVEERDPQYRHLAGIINPDESGEDNSPRFDMPMQVPPDVSFVGHMFKRYNLVEKNRVCNFDAEICMSQNFWVKDVPFNVILARNLQALAHIASFLGHKAGEHFALLHEGLIKEAMRERLFSDGVFWSAADHDYKPIKVSTWAHFAPLFADLYTKAEADALMEKYFNDSGAFRSQFGIRTVSKQEPSYRPDGFWRGPVWFAPHWFIYKGLRAYGYKDEAKFIQRANLALLERNGFREYFNPETGEAYGATDFTWGTLTLDMMEE
jgi:glycogen debranching enzyme